MSNESPGTEPDTAPVVADPEEPEAAGTGPAEKLDIATLPEQAQEYIRELRDEAKQTRLAADPAKKALAHFNVEEQAYLLQMIDTMGVDEQAGATAFLELGKRMGGIEKEAEEVVADPVMQAAAAEAGISREELVSTVRKEMEQEKAIAVAEAETRSLGFEPYTEEGDKLWDLAIALKEDDLSKVAPIARMALGLPEPEGEGQTDFDVGDGVKAADLDLQPTQDFPKTATLPASTSDVSTEERTPPPAIGSQELRERVMRRFEQANKPG